MTRAEKKKYIDKMNKRLKTLGKKYGNDNGLMEHIIDTLQNTEGVELTKSNLLSMKTDLDTDLVKDAIEGSVYTQKQLDNLLKETLEEETDGEVNLKDYAESTLKKKVNELFGVDDDLAADRADWYDEETSKNPIYGPVYEEINSLVHKYYEQDNGVLNKAHREIFRELIGDFKDTYNELGEVDPDKISGLMNKIKRYEGGV